MTLHLVGPMSVLAAEWWRFPGAPTADEWQAFYALVSVLIAAGGLAFAGFQLRQSALAAKRAAEAEEGQARPYLNVRFDLQVDASADPKKAHADEGVLFVLVESVGRTPAANIALTVSPEFETSGKGRPESDGPDPAMAALKWVFSGDKRISMLGPGEQLRYVLDFTSEVLDPESNLPTRYDVLASYTDADGARQHKSQFVLDLEPWRFSIMNASPIDVIARQVRRVNENLEKKD